MALIWVVPSREGSAKVVSFLVRGIPECADATVKRNHVNAKPETADARVGTAKAKRRIQKGFWKKNRLFFIIART
jgi:hypothetical protein